MKMTNYKEVKILYIYLLMAIIACIFIVMGVNNKQISSHEKNDLSLEVQRDSLQKEVEELERKVDILNRYLVMKNLEYIEACDLTYSK